MTPKFKNVFLRSLVLFVAQGGVSSHSPGSHLGEYRIYLLRTANLNFMLQATSGGLYQIRVVETLKVNPGSVDIEQNHKVKVIRQNQDLRSGSRTSLVMAHMELC
ncbi:uncharacterized protein BDV17DRAFT_250349 [Aspergillus undulatus]|uniref:uncharacterized protein n=1 Tax=Aspergillus undulatus TaxID=1810928 RepID=UPI003CCE3816